MDNNEKNISVILKQNGEDNKNHISFSFSKITENLKRYLLIWLIAAVVVAMMVIGVVMMLKVSISSGEVTALVNFNYAGVENGLDPNGKKLDVNKIKSPNIIESALTELDMPVSRVERIRRNISIQGLVPDSDYDEITIYREIFANGGSAAMSAAKALLEIGYKPSYYTISFNYSNTGLDLVESKQVLDAILKNYQKYFFTTYGYNESLGNSVVAIDYKEYDYTAAIDVFDNSLTNLNDYVTKLSKETPEFRSGKTGYSFSDLSMAIETIQDADLDSLSSYVVINNVTNDKEVLLNYYEYKIEQLERERNICQSELVTITNSIENYEKDSMVIIGESPVESDDNLTYSMHSKKYDELIEQKSEKQFMTSRYTERIDYYNERVMALKENKNNASDENVKEAEMRLADINEKVNNLINLVNKTADEYYETVTFAHAYNILVPATGAEDSAVSQDAKLPIIVAEGIVFMIYIAIVLGKSIIFERKDKMNKEAETSEDE